MKLSEELYKKAESIWIDAIRQPFLVEMAKGTLPEELFRNYMIQDYLYLTDYIDILNEAAGLSDDKETADFLSGIIEATRNETFRVHLSQMKKMGIGDDEVKNSLRSDVIKEYIKYLHKQMSEGGILEGLTALLQCSWNYAYIGQTMYEQYKKDIENSPYKEWFYAYSDSDYLFSNKLWIDMIDKKNQDIDSERADKLCKIFVRCAEFENSFWNALL